MLRANSGRGARQPVSGRILGLKRSFSARSRVNMSEDDLAETPDTGRQQRSAYFEEQRAMRIVPPHQFDFDALAVEGQPSSPSSSASSGRLKWLRAKLKSLLPAVGRAS